VVGVELITLVYFRSAHLAILAQQSQHYRHSTIRPTCTILPQVVQDYPADFFYSIRVFLTPLTLAVFKLRKPYGGGWLWGGREERMRFFYVWPGKERVIADEVRRRADLLNELLKVRIQW
jgi:hypothetical protein